MFPQVQIDDSCQNNPHTGPEKNKVPHLRQATERWEMLSEPKFTHVVLNY